MSCGGRGYDMGLTDEDNLNVTACQREESGYPKVPGLLQLI